MNNLIIDKLKQTKELKNNLKLEDLEYITKRRKYFSKYSLSIVF